MTKQSSQQKLSELDRAKLQTYACVQVADYTKALKSAQLAIALEPKNATMQALMALAMRGLGRFGDAQSHAKEATTLSPDTPDFLFVYGLCEWAAGNPKEAMAVLKQALVIDPKRDDIRLDYAGFLLYQQKFAEALIELELLDEEGHQHPKAALAEQCATDNQWKPAIDSLAFRPPLPLPKDEGSTFIALGKLHLSSNYYNLALDEFSKALDFDVNNQEAKELYATAFYLRENDFSSWCKGFRETLAGSFSAIMAVIVPLLIFAAGAFMAYSQNSLMVAGLVGLVSVLYLSAIAFFWVKGKVLMEAAQFDSLVNAYHLTPQGRISLTKHVIGDLDEVVSKKDTSHQVQMNENLRFPTGGFAGDAARIRDQRNERSRRLKSTSITFAWLSILMLFVLICSVILLKAPGLQHVRAITAVQQISFGLAIAFSGVAFWLRRRATATSSVFE